MAGEWEPVDVAPLAAGPWAVVTHASQPVPAGQGSTWYGRLLHGVMQPFEGMTEALAMGTGNPILPMSDAPMYTAPQDQMNPDAVAKAYKKAGEEYEAQRKASGSTGFDWWNLAGNVASPANFMGGAVSAPSRLGTALLTGGLNGAMQPVYNADNAQDYSKQSMTNTAVGAGASGVADTALRLGSAILNPVYSKAKQTLIDAGVPLTTGQLLGGPAKTMEDAATSIPLVGDMIKARQRDSFAGLNRAAIDQSLAPIGAKVPENLSGHEAVEYAADKLGDAYDALLPKLSASADTQLKNDVLGLSANARTNYLLPDAQAEQFDNILKAQISKGNAGFFDGDTLKNIQSSISKKARDYIKAADPDQRSLGQALMDARDVFNKFIARQNPAQAPELSNINEGWANYTRVRAAAAGATKDGLFTPAQLSAAVRRGGATQGQVATGNALMQGLANAGKDVLPSSVPDSGTATRHFYDLALGALVGGAGEHFAPEVAGPAIAAGAGASLLYSRPGQSAARAALTQRPDWSRLLGQNLLKYGSPVARGMAPGAATLLTGGQ